MLWRARYAPCVRFEELDEREQAWVDENEALWHRAHAVVARHPHLDVSLVYHTLVNFRRTPEERLARGLAGGAGPTIRRPRRAAVQLDES